MMQPSNPPELRFVVCVQNDGYAAALELRKLYQVLPDPSAATRHYVRVIDESGEDYLYPEDYFIPIELPETIKDVLLHVA